MRLRERLWCLAGQMAENSTQTFDPGFQTKPISPE